MATVQDSRILIKRSTVTTTVPTVPASSDHTDGTWLTTDIYKGEFFVNLPDRKVWSRDDNGIFELTNQYNINVRNNGISRLVGDGTTDDSAAFTALIAGVPAGSTLIFPAGYTFEVTGVTINKKLTLVGFGSKIITTSNATMLTIAADDVVISGIEFRGDAVTSKTSQIGIGLDGYKRWTIKDCKFYDFAGAGFYATNVYLAGTLSHGIYGCLFSNCKDNAGDPAGKGLWLGEKCEYVIVSHCIFDNCDIATYNTGGNNTYIGCHFTSNRIGGYIEAGTNNGHGKFIGCSFNHQTAYALWINDTALGFSIEGCHMYAGIIRFTDTSGVKITGGIMSVEGIWFENSIVSINNVVMANSYSNPISDNYNATVGYGLWYNNINLDATYSAAYNTVSPQLSYATATTVPYLDANKILQSSAVTPTELEYVSGVTSAIQTQLNTKHGYSLQAGTPQFNPSGTNTYFAGFVISTVASTGGLVGIPIPKTGIIKRVDIVFTNSGTLSSSEVSSIYIRINDSTDTLISNAVVADATRKVFSGVVNIPVTEGVDYFEIKWVKTANATSPTNIRINAIVHVE